ncbi:MAG: PH domain-containing protein [Pirellulaceae bacterium]|nr:PH domain-containing protein [Planctomycetales bacterium]MCA9204027.1 PH domain-containing protein [Planctomycetales bacterium]MCA9220098.1 PH domain-containing protein [Planctomycetales bacterium]
MQCPACSAEVDPAAVFCHKCGARLDEAASDSAGGEGLSPSGQKLQQIAQNRKEVDLDPEKELWTGGYSGKAMLGTWILTTVVSVGAIVLGVIFGGPPGGLIGAGIAVVAFIIAGLILAAKKLNVHYELTSQRFIHKSGILRRTTDRIEVIDMDDVTYEQGIVQRMLGVGTIKITSSDRSHPELVLQGIDDVARVAGMIDDVRRLERRRRGIHIEAI